MRDLRTPRTGTRRRLVRGVVPAFSSPFRPARTVPFRYKFPLFLLLPTLRSGGQPVSPRSGTSCRDAARARYSYRRLTVSPELFWSRESPIHIYRSGERQPPNPPPPPASDSFCRVARFPASKELAMFDQWYNPIYESVTSSEKRLTVRVGS